jgi:hypothetical protein
MIIDPNIPLIMINLFIGHGILGLAGRSEA